VALGSLVWWLATLHIAGGLKLDGPFQPRPFYDYVMIPWFIGDVFPSPHSITQQCHRAPPQWHTFQSCQDPEMLSKFGVGHICPDQQEWSLLVRGQERFVSTLKEHLLKRNVQHQPLTHYDSWRCAHSCYVLKGIRPCSHHINAPQMPT